MMPNIFYSVFAAILLCLVSVNPVAAANQNTLFKTLTSADIQQRIQTIKERTNQPEELKNRIIAIYTECDDKLKLALADENKAETLRLSMASLPVENKRLERQISAAENELKNPKPEKLQAIPTDELEQRLIIQKTQLSELDAEINRLDNAINEHLNRPQVIREQIAEIKDRQAAGQFDQKSLANQYLENTAEKDAVQMQQEIRARGLNARLKALEMENISEPASLQMQKNRKNLLGLQREQLTMQIADLDNFLLDKRQQEIDKEQIELAQAEKAAAGKHPLIQVATKENMRLNRNLQDITRSMEQYSAQKNELEQRYKQLEKDFQSAEQKINLAGLSPALGNLLREQRRNLPQRKHFNALNENIQNEIAKASLETFKLEEAKKKLLDVGQELTAQMDAALPPDTSDSDKLKIRTELRMLLNDQKDLVLRLESVYTEYTRILGEVDFSLRQMLTVADKYSEYLDQRLLWVPSAPVIDKYYLTEIARSVVWFARPGNWLQMTQNVWQGINNYPAIALLGFIIVSLHWRLKDRITDQLRGLLPKKTAANLHAFSFGQTLLALVYTLILSLSGPLLMIWMASVLLVSGSKDLFSHAFATGLFSAAVSLTVMQFFYRLFKPEGIAEILFEWRHQNSFILFKQFKWGRFLLVPCVFMIAMTTGNDVFSEYSYALGRSALIIMMAAMLYLFHQLTHPNKGLVSSFYLQKQGWSKSLPYLGYLLALSIPLLIIGFAVAGYYQSALQLEHKLLFSLRLIFITVLFHELSQRWLVVTQRKLALQNAHQKRKQLELVATHHLDSPLSAPEQLLDISKIDQQSHKLLTTVIVVMVFVGCWIIWRDILPAFAIFDRVELWQHIQIVDSKETLQPITLTNLLIAIAYAVLAFVIVNNFPALVDLLSAGKFQLSPGSRYALIQLTRYLLVTIAFLAIANELGGSWSQVQWLVAALSVGLGFGLQEIFANMVSGIIILFERPFRVGDTVTVGDVTGRVSRIQMRATHIVDWDRKELVVPNKIFITDRLINWTLSDTVTRVVISVGVGYGSEISLVEQVLAEAVKQTPGVLAEPSASVLFTSFGENALLFDIHVFVHELADRLMVKHKLHKYIYEALQSHGIEMPFPHRDIRIRGMENVNLTAETIPNLK